MKSIALSANRHGYRGGEVRCEAACSALAFTWTAVKPLNQVSRILEKVQMKLYLRDLADDISSMLACRGVGKERYLCNDRNSSYQLLEISRSSYVFVSIPILRPICHYLVPALASKTFLDDFLSYHLAIRIFVHKMRHKHHDDGRASCNITGKTSSFGQDIRAR